MGDSYSLWDGTAIEIRPLEPEDRRGYAAAFSRLSPESRYRRFFGPMPELSEGDLDYLTAVDHEHHEALVAIDPRTRQGIGVARYVRIAEQLAEPAVAVVDAWQRRGVGSLLMAALAGRARQAGITHFRAPVLATNREAIAAVTRLGPTTREQHGSEVVLSVRLPARGPGPGRPGPGAGGEG
jgi:GNAT superfamily N-acetyltransferase